MLGIEITGLVNDRRILLMRLFREFLNGLRGYVAGLIRSNLALRTTEHTRQAAQAAAPRRAYQLVQNAGALLIVGLSEHARDHLAERGGLIRSKCI